MEKHYLKHKQRLRERFIKEGLDGFHDYEVLELLLNYSLVRKDTKTIAKKLIEHFGSISDVMNAPVNELTKIEGVSGRTAVLLKMVKQSSVYMMKDKILRRYYVKSSQDVFSYLKYYYKGEKVETFLIIYLNTKNMIIGVEPLFRGTVNEAKVYMRTIVERSLQNGASAIIAVHNHPSGSPDFSQEDIRLTRKLKEALKLINVRLLDHIIIADNEMISMNDNKLIP